MTDTLVIMRAQEVTLSSNKNAPGKTYKMILSPTKKTITDIQTDISASVKKSGDTMTGTLNLSSNGLVVGTNQLIVSGGNVGIGTTSPLAKLSVSGGSTPNQIEIDPNTHTTEGMYNWINFNGAPTYSNIVLGHDSGANNLKIYYGGLTIPNGNIGIGTMSPVAKLHLSTSASGVVQELLRLDNSPSAGIGTGMKISFNQGANEYGRITSKFIDTLWELNLGSQNYLDTMTLKSGNVGIGATSPEAKVHI